MYTLDENHERNETEILNFYNNKKTYFYTLK